jgi:hypothetical protein
MCWVCNLRNEWMNVQFSIPLCCCLCDVVKRVTCMCVLWCWLASVYTFTVYTITVYCLLVVVCSCGVEYSWYARVRCSVCTFVYILLLDIQSVYTVCCCMLFCVCRLVAEDWRVDIFRLGVSFLLASVLSEICCCCFPVRFIDPLSKGRRRLFLLIFGRRCVVFSLSPLSVGV